ncbi:hypothetical protein QWY14_04070 [Planococcus sp. N028]|uniref:Uncharacterized protein n=1 Tax=Planococcus shixiaomingii TaxID=3058393 RepID=A0ABT8N072_9BACL|nr:hypothetical protein [Planococcus sp. N028]MDN7240950.1 hypothetical protein [Planococcus sp. N028]
MGMKSEMRKAFFKEEKWMILLFVFCSITGYVLSVIFNGGPATYSGPIGLWLGFCLHEASNYKRFKKKWKTRRQCSVFKSL